MERRQLGSFERQKRQVSGYCSCEVENNCPRGEKGPHGLPGLC